MNVLTPQQDETSQEQNRAATPPPLNSGDVLSRAEFERRYQAHPEIKKAELIEGVVYVASPTFPRHGGPHGDIMTWLGVYRSATPSISVFDNTSLRLDADNEVQPDAAVIIHSDRELDLDDYLQQTPVLVIEVAASSAAHDLHQKLNVYRRNGVPEYLVLLAHERETRWYRWREGEYVPIEPDEQGVLRSDVLPGLWLHSERFWQGDLAAVLATLQDGLQSDEHKTFVETLQQSATAKHAQ